MIKDSYFCRRILLLILACQADGSATSLHAAEEQICFVEARDYPGRDDVMWDALYAARSGRVYTGLITEGGSAHFYVYDPAAGQNRLLYDIAEFLGERGKGIRTSCKIHNKPVEDEEGNIYFVPLNNGGGPRTIDFTSWQGGHWLRYDPKQDRLENLGLVDQQTGIYPLAMDPKRMYLFGVGFTGYLYRFDIQKRITKNLGRVSNWDVCRDIFCDDRGNVYGSFPVGRIWKYDAQSERVCDLSISMPYDPSYFPTQLKNPMIDRTCDWRAVEWDPVDKVAYGVTCGSGSVLFRYDPHDGPEGSFTALAQICDSRFWDTNRKDVPYSPLAFALDNRNKRVYFVPSAREYLLDAYAETFGSLQDHHLILYDLRANQRMDLGALRISDGRRVFGCEAASVAPDGTLYICSQAEVKNPEQATRQIGDMPAAMQLLIFKPDNLSKLRNENHSR